jgi:hypothetical protein
MGGEDSGRRSRGFKCYCVEIDWLEDAGNESIDVVRHRFTLGEATTGHRHSKDFFLRTRSCPRSYSQLYLPGHVVIMKAKILFA